jgi:hypothetical protein
MDKNDFSKQVQSAVAQIQQWWRKNPVSAWGGGALIVCVLGYMLFFSSGRTPDLSVEPLISVSKINTPNRWERSPAYVPLVKIVAKDNVTIQQVILNRGNCQAPWNEQAAEPRDRLPDPFRQPWGPREMWLGMVGVQLPKSLKFGETLELPLVLQVCELLEAEVKTDKGDWTFTWK